MRTLSIFLLSLSSLWLAACANDPAAVEIPPAVWEQLIDPLDVPSLNAVAVSDENDAVAVGDAGDVFAFDGSAWTSIAPGDPVDFLDVHPLSDGTLVVAANAPRVFFRRDGEWSTRPVSGLGNHRSVWASGIDNVYLAGNQGRLVHSTAEGSTWVEVDGERLSDISHVWGTSPTNVYTVGLQGLFHFDGNEWSEILLGIQDEFSVMEGLPSGEFFMVTKGQRLYYFDGTNFWIDDLGLPIVMVGGWIAEPGVVALLGRKGEVVRWENLETTVSPGPGAVAACVGAGRLPDGSALILERSATAFRHTAGATSFHSVVVPPRVTLRALWGSSPRDLVAILADDQLLHRTAGVWSLHQIPDFEPAGVWGSSAARVVATGLGPGLAMFDGVEWSPAPVAAVQFLAIHGSGPRHIVAAGAAGTVATFDGQAWSDVQLNTDRALSVVWTSGPAEILTAAPPRAFLARFDGSAWSEIPGFGQLTGNVRAVWADAQGVTAVMSDESVHGYDGVGWTQLHPPGAQGYWKVIPLRGGGAVLARNGGDLLLWREGKLQPYELPPALRAATVLTAWDPDGLLMGGTRGLLWSLARP